MDISKISGYSSVNPLNQKNSGSAQANTAVKVETDSQQSQVVDPDKSAIMTYIRGQEPATTLNPPSHTFSDVDLVESSAIAEARNALNERREIEDKKKREEAALEKAKEALSDIKARPLALRFDTVEDYNDAHVLQVVDAQSDELIRQIPNEELLRVAALISSYKERIAHEEMTTDPQLKSHGVTTNAQANENLRGVVLDDVI